MKILFIARHFSYFRNFDSVIEMLAARGHDVHLAADREETLGGRDLVERLADQSPRITVGFTPMAEWGRHRRVASALRLGLDYLRYTDPRYESTPRLRERARARTPAFALALAKLPFRRLVTRAMSILEAAVPPQAGVEEFIAGHRPDVLLITPLIELGSPQLDFVRVARRRGVRTALCVWSWDHLSSKALIREAPDALLVWNETQRREAELFHGIPAARVIVTGAQCFDRWFDRTPAREHTDFCRAVGLAPARPFLLYVCSVLFRGSPSEATFVRQWVAAIRAASAPELRNISILVRPHPQRLDEWKDAGSLRAEPNTVIWGSNPIDEGRRSDYFDSLFHSVAVVGLNTSALVEAAVVGRPVFTPLLPEFEENQEGTFHFRYLCDVGGGCVRTARTLEAHIEQLSAQVSGGSTYSNRSFVEQFVRPHGVASPATPRFVDAAEAVAADSMPQRQAAVVGALLLRPVVWALTIASRVPGLDRLYWNPTKQETARHAATDARKQSVSSGQYNVDTASHRLRESNVPRTEAVVNHSQHKP